MAPFSSRAQDIVGNGYKTHRDYLEGRLQLPADSVVLRLASQIKLKIEPVFDKKCPLQFVADVTVRFRDGGSEHLFLGRVTGTPPKRFASGEFQGKLDERNHASCSR